MSPVCQSLQWTICGRGSSRDNVSMTARKEDVTLSIVAVVVFAAIGAGVLIKSGSLVSRVALEEFWLFDEIHGHVGIRQRRADQSARVRAMPRRDRELDASSRKFVRPTANSAVKWQKRRQQNARARPRLAGSEPATSASPPVFAKPTTSDAANQIALRAWGGHCIHLTT